MSLKKELWDRLGDEFQIVSVKVIEDNQHGEPGRTATIVCKGKEHEIFLADDRKITDDHAVAIIRSYLNNNRGEPT